MNNITLKKRERGRPKNEFKTNTSEQYMSVSEVADMLKMSQSHIYTLTSTKKIPHIKLLGKKLLFDKKEINEWLKSKKVSAK
jgi:excisionase family DNA binding protein